MVSPKLQSSSAKRKQLHPKKQVIESILLQKKSETSIILKASSSISFQQDNSKILNDKSEVVPNFTPGQIFINDELKLPVSNYGSCKALIIDSSSANAQISNEPYKQNSSTEEIQEDINFSKYVSSEIKLVPLDSEIQMCEDINIETIKVSSKQKLDFLVPDSNLNIKPNPRITLTERKKIVQQKMRKFFADASLHTTIIRNAIKSEVNEISNGQNNNPNNEKVTTKMKGDNGSESIISQMIMIGEKSVLQQTKSSNGVLPITLKNKKILAPKKINRTTKTKNIDSGQKKQITEKCFVNSATKSDKKSSNKLKNNTGTDTSKSFKTNSSQQCEEFDTIIKVARTLNTNDKDESKFVSGLQTAKTALFSTNAIIAEKSKCISEMQQTYGKMKFGAIIKNSAENYSVAKLKKTAEKNKNMSSKINLNGADEYVACLQTVEPSSPSVIKAIASIKELKEISPEKIRKASENILGYNIEMINLVNRFSKASKNPDNKNIGNGIPSKISTNKLEDTLSYALGKKPRKITIIKNSKETNDIRSKSSITYINELDSALNTTLGSNSKLLPFVKKMINTSDSNLMKTNSLKNNRLKDQLRVIIQTSKTINDSGKLETSKSNSEIISDAENFLGFESSEIPGNRNSKLEHEVIKSNDKIEENRKLPIIRKKLVKSTLESVRMDAEIPKTPIIQQIVAPAIKSLPTNERNIKLISFQKDTELNPTVSVANLTHASYKHVMDDACETKQFILKRLVKPNSNVYTSGVSANKRIKIYSEKESQSQALSILKTPVNTLKPSEPYILKRNIKISKSKQISSNTSSPKKLKIIAPVKLLETVPNTPKPIIIKRLIKRNLVQEINLNIVNSTVQTNACAQDNFKTAKKDEPVSVKPATKEKKKM